MTLKRLGCLATGRHKYKLRVVCCAAPTHSPLHSEKVAWRSSGRQREWQQTTGAGQYVQ